MDDERRLAALVGATSVEELPGGHQSRAFRAIGAAGPFVVKVLDAALADRSHVEMRVDLVAELADVDPQVCRPVPIGGALVTEVALDCDQTGLVTCWEDAGGVPLEPGDADDAARMGRALARLHASLRQLGPRDLPPVPALRGVPSGDEVQLLHGDVNAGNLRRVGDTIRIFDFDDCGYGPTLFDVANALYMVRFDDAVSDGPPAGDTFAALFVAGYAEVSGTSPDPDELDRFVDLRVDALAAWLDDLVSAPIGIRTASPAWHATLRTFVDRHRADPS